MKFLYIQAYIANKKTHLNADAQHMPSHRGFALL